MCSPGSNGMIPAASLHCVLPVAQMAVAAQTKLVAPARLSWTLEKRSQSAAQKLSVRETHRAGAAAQDCC